MTAQRIRGFTVVELLVVIAIIGVLMAMLIPAVQAARESARRAQCINNQSQIAKAVATYESSKGLMPPSRSRPPYVPPPPAPSGMSAAFFQAPQFGWVHPLLANLDQAQLADRLFDDPLLADQVQLGPFANTTIITPDKRPEFEVYIPMLVCPSDPPTVMTGGPFNYVVNSGRANNTAVPKDMPVDWRANGAFSDTLDSRPPVENSLTFITMHDGVSNTIMLSENRDATFWTDVRSEASQTILWQPVSDVLDSPSGRLAAC